MGIRRTAQIDCFTAIVSRETFVSQQEGGVLISGDEARQRSAPHARPVISRCRLRL